MARDRYKSEISEAVHSAVRDFFDVGLADQETMRKFDKSCLTAITPFRLKTYPVCELKKAYRKGYLPIISMSGQSSSVNGNAAQKRQVAHP